MRITGRRGGVEGCKCCIGSLGCVLILRWEMYRQDIVNYISIDGHPWAIIV